MEKKFLCKDADDKIFDPTLVLAFDEKEAVENFIEDLGCRIDEWPKCVVVEDETGKKTYWDVEPDFEVRVIAIRNDLLNK